MTMTGLFVDQGIRILAAVALLAVMSSPIRPTRASHIGPSPGHLPRNLVILNNGYSGESAMSACPSLREADSLQSDIENKLDADVEDELTVKSPPATVSFDVPPLPVPSLTPNASASLSRLAADRSAAEPDLPPASSVSRGAIIAGRLERSHCARMGPPIALRDCAQALADAPVRCPHDRPGRGASWQCSQKRQDRF